MKNKIICLSLFLLLIIPISTNAEELYKNNETGYSVIIEDDANLLTNQEEENLLNEIKKITEYGNTMFKTIDENTTSTSNFARQIYRQKFEKNSGTLFLIDMYNRQIYIFSDGDNSNIITNYKAEIITDNVYNLAKNKDYYECSLKAFEQIYTILNGEKIFEPMRYICNFLFSFSIVFLVMYIIISILSSKPVASNKNIIKCAKNDIKVNSITGIQTGEHRVYNPPDDSYSSSSGGGGFSGGGFSGGSSGSSGSGGGHGF